MRGPSLTKPKRRIQGDVPQAMRRIVEEPATPETVNSAPCQATGAFFNGLLLEGN